MAETSSEVTLGAQEQMELYVCDIDDAAIKEIIPGLEHPFYTLSSRPDIQPRSYRHGDKWLEIQPSALGLPTVYDKDILIYVISQIMARADREGGVITPRIRFHARDYLLTTNRKQGARDYDALMKGMKRLSGSLVTTNIQRIFTPEDREKGGDEGGFHFIEKYMAKRQGGDPNGRLLWIEIELSDWLLNLIKERIVLTLHPNYFTLRSPLKKRLYEIGRKHCGNQASFTIGIELLHQKTGSRAPLRNFRCEVKKIALENQLPDYKLAFIKETDQLTYTLASAAEILPDEPPPDVQNEPVLELPEFMKNTPTRNGGMVCSPSPTGKAGTRQGEYLILMQSPQPIARAYCMVKSTMSYMALDSMNMGNIDQYLAFTTINADIYLVIAET